MEKEFAKIKNKTEKLLEGEFVEVISSGISESNTTYCLTKNAHGVESWVRESDLQLISSEKILLMLSTYY